MSGEPLGISPQGPPETVLAPEPADALAALDAALAAPSERRRAAVSEVVARWPRFLDAWARLGDVAVMGNFDPVALFTTHDIIRRRAKVILDRAANRPGHVFNLGHGILPETPVENVVALVEAVHELSRR